MLKRVAFTMYPVIDMNRARNFYEKILKLKPGLTSPDGGWVEYDLPGGGCFAITTLAEGVKPSADFGGSVAFEVENLEDLVKQLKADGVKFKVDIFPTHVCKIAVMLDSEGNAVTLHKLKRES
jgi:predicted enzyme related to lactoylglutathione lyase